MLNPHRLVALAAASLLAAVTVAAQTPDVPPQALACITSGTKAGHSYI